MTAQAAIISLLKLQEFDLKIDELVNAREHGPRELIKLNKLRQDKQALIDQEKVKADKLKADLHQKEREMEEEAASMKKKQDRANDLRNQKEYQASAREVEASRMEIGILEEDVQILRERLQKQEQAHTDVQTKLAPDFAELDAQKKTIEDQLATLETQYNALKAEREPHVKSVPSDVLSKYSRLRSVRKGKAILVGVNTPSCPACYMRIAPQKFNDLQKTRQIMACDCNQVLWFWKDANVEVEVKPS